MSKREVVKIARRYFGQSVIAQGSEVGTGYANRCYLLRRKVSKRVIYETVGIGRTWERALRDTLSQVTIREGGVI